MKRIILWKKGHIHPAYHVLTENYDDPFIVLSVEFPELKNRGYGIYINDYNQENFQGEYADRSGDKRCSFCGYIILEDEEECPFCGREV